MLLTELLQGVEYTTTSRNIEINGIEYDSRKVKKGNLFVAIKGFVVDGHDFASDAVENGAQAVLVERKLALDIPQVVVKSTREALGQVASNWYGHPSSAMRLVGVTGTNGKTTTTYLVKSILEKAGYKVGLIGTIQNLIGNEVIPAERTTPESLDLQRLLSEMRDANVDYVVMEVSSHALDLHRTQGAEYDVGIFTNLSQDHLDFHETLEAYFSAKSKLFANLTRNSSKAKKLSVINFDDSHGLQMAASSSAPVFSYGVDQHAQVCAKDIEVTNKGVRYRVKTPQGEAVLALNLTGKFNIYNSLAAITACLWEGVSLSTIKAGLEQVLGVAGRFELVDAGQDFAVIVDYAHTPDSLENVLQTAKGFAKGRLLLVFGAGGDRDRKKRPLMGKTAAKYSDYLLVTSDNPRSEDPEQICQDVAAGILEVGFPKEKYEIVVSRRAAISRGVQLAQPGDILIIAGKGHETYQEFKGKTIHFDDKEEALQALKELR